MELFRETFPEVHIETLYIGNGWLAYLRQAGISYCTRCKVNAQIAGKGGTRQALNCHFRALKTGEGKRLGPVMMYGQQHYLEATRLTDGQLPVVCSDKEGKGIEAYGERWQIETLFGSLKSKGFNLEDTHMTAPAKRDRLMSVPATGFVLSCRAGEAEDKRRPIKVKKHGRPAQSLFRAGLDRPVSVLFRGMRLLEVLGGEVTDLLAVKEDVG
ncbi:transposase [Cardiobacterium valvarum]|uniref:transposase n=1 Tax=Cardiobacterium valvarum TaxID=194702 RepID=UPI001FE436E7|nr:transposase [Cardiobacterium valvarum]